MEFVTPAKFADFGDRAKSLGFVHVASGPLVRSSYHADEFTLPLAAASLGVATLVHSAYNHFFLPPLLAAGGNWFVSEVRHQVKRVLKRLDDLKLAVGRKLLLLDESFSGLRRDEIAILYRSNAQSRVMEDALRRSRHTHHTSQTRAARRDRHNTRVEIPNSRDHIQSHTLARIRDRASRNRTDRRHSRDPPESHSAPTDPSDEPIAHNPPGAG